jgi:hypothetical protein
VAKSDCGGRQRRHDPTSWHGGRAPLHLRAPDDDLLRIAALGTGPAVDRRGQRMRIVSRPASYRECHGIAVRREGNRAAAGGIRRDGSRCALPLHVAAQIPEDAHQRGAIWRSMRCGVAMAYPAVSFTVTADEGARCCGSPRPSRGRQRRAAPISRPFGGRL